MAVNLDLKISASVRSGKNPLDKARERLVADIDAQIKLAKDPKFSIKRVIKKRTGGNETMTRRPRSWVTVDGDAAYIAVRFSNKPLNPGGRKGQFVKCAAKDVTKALGQIKAWAESPESDDVLAKAIEGAKRKPRKAV